MDERPFPPGDYPVVVVGSGPGGLQASHCLARLGVEHAVISQDDSPGGMFRLYPIYQRLLSWSKPDAPAEPGTRAYEWYDHNSLVSDDPRHQALVPAFMDRSFMVPSRDEMERGLAAFADRFRCRCATAAAGRRPGARTTGGSCSRPRTASTGHGRSSSRSA